MATLGKNRLVELLDEAVDLGEPKAIVDQIAGTLSTAFHNGDFELPEAFTRPCDDCYARRLLHRDERRGYTAVVMTWGVGQRTPLHDHAGMWCVEGVLSGRVDVTRYNLTGRQNGYYDFEYVDRIQAGVGATGSLIPPYEYHVLGNALPDRPSVTLHVYGGEMDHCCIYLPREDGTYEQVRKALSYND